MEDLTKKVCVACEGGVAPLNAQETKPYLAQLKTRWDVVDGKKIRREFSFKDFKEAMSFVNDVAALAEKEGHHPDIAIFYNTVSIELWTRAISGLSENDFIVAAKIEERCTGRKAENPVIAFDDFAKVRLKAVRVLEAQRVEGSEKLLKLQVDLGTEKRQIVAGIGKAYAPENLVGKHIIVVANLAPRKLMGLESQGMVLAATGQDGPVLLVPDKEVPPGSSIS